MLIPIATRTDKKYEVVQLRHHNQEFHCRIFRGYIKLLEDAYPNVDVDKYCERAGITREYLKGNNWLDMATGVRLTELAIELTGDEEFPGKAGELSLHPDLIGKDLNFLASIATTSQVYAQIAKLWEYFSKVTHAEIKNRTATSIHIELSVSKKYRKYKDRDLIKKVFEYATQSTLGYLTQIPTIQGLPHALVSASRKSDAYGFPSVDIKVNFHANNKIYDWVVRPLLLGSVLLAPVIGHYALETSLEVILLCVSWVLAVFICLVSFKEKKSRKEFTSALKRIEVSDEKYRSLLEFQKQREIDLKATERFVPWKLLAFLGKSHIREIELEDNCEFEATILFADIRNFTQKTATMSSSETYRFLNNFWKEISPAVHTHEGVVLNIPADGIIACFPHTPKNGLNAALSFLNKLKGYNEKVSPEDKIRMGIALHFGKVSFGILGDNSSFTLTTVGDVVNTASRIEGLNKVFKTEILCTQQVINELSPYDMIDIRRLPAVKVKGKDELPPIYEVIDRNNPHLAHFADKHLSRFDEAASCLSDGDIERAYEIYLELASVNPADEPLKAILDLEVFKQLWTSLSEAA